MRRDDFHHPPISKAAFCLALPALRWVTVTSDGNTDVSESADKAKSQDHSRKCP
jgi:hypothetical protein